MWIFKKIDCGLKVVPLVQPEVLDSGHVAATRGASVKHRKGFECTDPKFDRHCVGRWRGSVTLGFDADGNRIRRRVTGSTKTAVLEARAELRGELGRAPRSSSTYTVAEAVNGWLEDGLPGRSARTKTIYKDGLAPHQPRQQRQPDKERPNRPVAGLADSAAERAPAA